MKKALVIFWLLLPFVALAASNADSAFYIENIPKNGISLVRGWKFHAGDNRAWAAPSYNDTSWQAIDPSKRIYFLPEVSNAQIGWFRLKLLVGKALRGKTVALAVQQIGASEIYLDGALIAQYGKVSSSYSKEETYNPNGGPLTIKLSDKPEQVLAVRYSYTRQNLFIGYGHSVFQILINRPAAAWDNFTDHTNHSVYRSFMCGVFIIFCVLQLFIYLTYHNRKISLYLSLLSFFQACCFINGFLETSHNPTSDLIFQIIFYVSISLTWMFFLVIVYSLFSQPKKLLFKLLAVFCIIIIPLEFWRDIGDTEVLLASLITLIYLETTRISAIAFKRKQPGSKLFLCGQCLSFFFFCVFNYDHLFNKHLPYILHIIAIDLANLIPVIVLSILLAREFAQNNISLIHKLDEVKKLSERSLAQELEKQQLLASQNEVLEKQVEERTKELSHSLENLRQTQSQLIQSEKMASLGELTAGIAHEIQNPLNFVNNFSEVNTELIDEMQQEIDKGDLEEIRAIALDIQENEKKINMHGKRADGIVKGMLEHSRSHSGQKEPTDLNLMADEFMRLAYHGLRAKDKSFNAELLAHFDPDLPKINLMQQDIGRVLLNLFNNAFYAVNQRQKTAGPDYKPEVTVTTSVENGQVIIRVKDNGVGIPDAIKEKIMQPFFTTKPTGEGTGLGLSLTYDMVVKGHGGKIEVESKENEYTEFIIILPLT